MHILWLAILAVALGQPTTQCSNVTLLEVYLRINIVLVFASLFLECIIGKVSLQGTVCNSAPRKSLRIWIPLYVLLATIDLFTQALGLYVLFGAPNRIDCPKSTILVLAHISVFIGVVSQLIWFIALAQIFILSSPVNFSTLQAKDSWDKWLRILCFGHSSSSLNRTRSAGNHHTNDNLLRDVARVFGDIFQDAETVVSDIFIGLIYVRHLQRKDREGQTSFSPTHPQNQTPATDTKRISASSPGNPTTTTHQPSGFSMDLSYSQTFNNIPMSNLGSKSQSAAARSTTTTTPNISDSSASSETAAAQIDRELLNTRVVLDQEMQDIIHFSQYSEAIYGLPLHMITNWSNFTRALQILCVPEWCLPHHHRADYHGQPQNVIENVRNHLGKPGWPFCCVEERAPRHRHSDLLAISLENGFFRSPYMVCLDHDKKMVVVAVRGTMSTADVLVDLICDLEPLNIPQQASDGTWLPPIHSKTHAGISQTAKHITQEVTGLLESLVLDPQSEYKEYGILLCGHSLGAGVAALLAHHLRINQNLHHKVKCYCYSPPGCITTPRANAAHFRHFVTSVVLGDEVVPRLNRRSVERLKRLVKKGVASCRVRKVDVVGGFIGAECFGVQNGNIGDFDDMFRSGSEESDGMEEGTDEIEVNEGAHTVVDVADRISGERQSVERAGIEDGMLADRESFDDGTAEEDEELQIPGRVIHFRKQKIAGDASLQQQDDAADEGDCELDNGSNADLVPRDGGNHTQMKKVYRAVWSEPNHFHDIVISSTMVSEHMPHILGSVLRRSELNSQGRNSDSFVADVDFREWRT
ncbi:hypothetical protein BDR26DRAFT_850366 [Obelidium mucronatum]|nr:hypothetical protein BDR26DRAFT_850366 [Obelidium mucronatum]